MKETTKKILVDGVKFTAGSAALVLLGAGCLGACEWMKQPDDEAHTQAFDESFATEQGDCLYGTVYDPDQGANVEAFLNTSAENFSVIPNGEYPHLTFYRTGYSFEAGSDETQAIMDQYGCNLSGAQVVEPSSSASIG